METYRILSYVLPPSNCLRSPLTSLRSPHMVGLEVFCLPYAPQRCSPLVDRPCFAPDGENPGKRAPVRLPSLGTLASLAAGK